MERECACRPDEADDGDHLHTIACTERAWSDWNERTFGDGAVYRWRRHPSGAIDGYWTRGDH